ncbi:type II/IV secretion system protein [Candidatus Roizmanbacteria bacterium]|nr:type II/IV secretion system protein [Candidatus Roizmanbacteria bacterium]
MHITPRRVLKILLQKGILDKEKAERIEFESLKNDIPIAEYLFKNTTIDKKDILASLSDLMKVPYVDIATSALDPQALGFVSELIARKYVIIPVRYDAQNETVTIATTDPFDISVSDFLERKTGKKIVLALGYRDDIKKTIDLAYSQSLTPEVKEALKEVQVMELIKEPESSGAVIKEAPISKIVNTILEFAVKSRASDIHIEPEQNKTRVRYRIDGILHDKLTLPLGIHNAIVSRIKILSEMKIDERRIPQDGRFYFRLGEEEDDLRISTLPTVNGEKVVLRLLKKTGGLPSLSELGLRGTPLKSLEEAILKPYGIVLVTGPTGSGKTTTLYSILSILNKPSVNIITLEDPVEYQIPGVNQVQINPQAGLTFSTGLRSILRQDPNIVLVGEIRDKETTQLTIQASLTGHLVFSTLHTSDAATAIPRLIDLGGEPFLIASVLNASLAQRIVRRICNYCKMTYEPPEEVQKNIKLILGDLLSKPYLEGRPIQLVKGEGCDECEHTGYLGRIATFEVLKITPSINTMILKQATSREIEEQAKKEGLITMVQDGYLKALDGITTIEEILRVTEI